MICKIEECNNPVHVKKHQMCQKHYLRFYHHGDPHFLKQKGRNPGFRPKVTMKRRIKKFNRGLSIIAEAFENPGDVFRWT